MNGQAGILGLDEAGREHPATSSLGDQVWSRAALGHWVGRLTLSALPWVALLSVWVAIRGSGLVSPALLPAPSQVFAQGWASAASGELWQHLLTSTARVLGGVLIGTTLAVPVGFLLGRLPVVLLIFEPLINFGLCRRSP